MKSESQADIRIFAVAAPITTPIARDIHISAPISSSGFWFGYYKSTKVGGLARFTKAG